MPALTQVADSACSCKGLLPNAWSCFWVLRMPNQLAVRTLLLQVASYHKGVNRKGRHYDGDQHFSHPKHHPKHTVSERPPGCAPAGGCQCRSCKLAPVSVCSLQACCWPQTRPSVSSSCSSLLLLLLACGEVVVPRSVRLSCQGMTISPRASTANSGGTMMVVNTCVPCSCC